MDKKTSEYQQESEYTKIIEAQKRILESAQKTYDEIQRIRADAEARDAITSDDISAWALAFLAGLIAAILSYVIFG